jgi:hypothetical protein
MPDRTFQTLGAVLAAIPEVASLVSDLATVVSAFRSDTSSDLSTIETGLSGVGSSITGLSSNLNEILTFLRANGGLDDWESAISADLQLTKSYASDALRDIHLVGIGTARRLDYARPPLGGTVSYLRDLDTQGSWTLPDCWGVLVAVNDPGPAWGRSPSAVNPDGEYLCRISFGRDDGYTRPVLQHNLSQWYLPLPFNTHEIVWEMRGDVTAALSVLLPPNNWDQWPNAMTDAYPDGP